MSSGVLTQKIEVAFRTIRYYEEMGLIEPKAKANGGRKSYGSDAV